MKQVYSLLAKLKSLGIKVFLDGTDLKYRSYANNLTPEILNEIKAEKENIIAYFKNISDASKIEKQENYQYTPLSFTQQSIWFLEQLLPKLGLYHIPMALRLTGELNKEALLKSLNTIVTRHEILRTKILTVDGITYQEVLDIGFNLKTEKIDQSEEYLLNKIKKETAKPFDFNNECLFRGLLLELNKKAHVLVLTFHHIITDGWSDGIFLNELITCYSSYSSEHSPTLPDLPIQYKDYSIWQRKWLQGDRLEEQLFYWKEKLLEVSTLIFPSKPRPKEQSYKGKHLLYYLPKETLSKLNQLANENDVTLFIILLAAFKGMLSKVCNQSDIALGTPIANRQISAVGQLIGFFVNTLVLRTDCGNNPTFRELAKKVEKTFLEAYEHQDVPFDKLVEHLNIDRDLSRQSLFQVMFTLQNTGIKNVNLGNLELERMLIDDGLSMFDLMVTTGETEKGLYIEYEYAEDLFDEKYINRLNNYYVKFIEYVLDSPNAHLSEIPILDLTEKAQIKAWNDTQFEYPKDKCAHELFEEQAEKNPNKIAIIYQGKKISYRELNNQANNLAHYLRSIGVGPEIVVAVLLERGIEFAVSMLAIFKAGGVYVPLDPSIINERTIFILEDTKPKILLTEKKYSDFTKKRTNLPALLVNEYLIKYVENTNAHNLATLNTPNNLAYIIFTSGSTGNPKGVMVKQGGMLNHLFCKVKDLALNTSDNVAQIATQIFDISVWQFFAALIIGGKICILREENVWDPEKLLAEIINEDITILQIVPSHALIILNFLESNKDKYQTLPLRCLVITGESLLTSICKKWLSFFPNIPIINAYGPTECSDDVTHHKVITETQCVSNIVPIGRALGNCKIYILSSDFTPVPLGSIGEIYINGDGLARGYFNKPALTAEYFIPNPFKEEDTENIEARLYKTGDLGRYLEDGSIEFLGRIDHQVKIRGYRIELGEIESIIQSVKGIKHCIVIAREDSKKQKRLIGYVVPESNKKENELIDKCIERCKNKLPDYMQPLQIIVLKNLPLTSNGKVDRKALPVPEDREGFNKYEEPIGLLEKELANIWKEILDIDNAGRNDNFFNLGGHSLLATKLISKIRINQNAEIPLKLIFEYPILKDLANAIKNDDSLKNILPAIRKINKKEQIPLSLSQQKIWLLDKFLPNFSLYNTPIAFKIIGELDKESLINSLNTITKRHEALRTEIETINGIIYQKISDSDFNLKIEKLEDGILDRIQNELAKPFGFNESLARGLLIELNKKESILVLTFHEAIMDGWSKGIFSKELTICYEAYRNKQIPKLAELQIQYKDYSAWQSEWLQGEILDKQLSYWKKQLADAPMLALPGKQNPIEQNYKGRYYVQHFSKEKLELLNKLAKDNNVTLFVVLLATLKATFSVLCDQNDVVIGTYVANRRILETEQTIGSFVNTVALRTNCDNNPRFSELIKKVEKTSLEAFEHQDIPFDQLMDYLDTSKSFCKKTMIPILFALHNMENKDIKLGDLTLNYITKHDTLNEILVKFDLTIEAKETENGLYIGYEYAIDIYDEENIELLSNYYSKSIEQILNNPDVRILEIYN